MHGDAVLLDWLLRNGGNEPSVHRRLAEMLDRMFRAIPAAPVVVCHTDAGPHNTVWDGAAAVPIDFEFACPAPADLDLEHVLRTVTSQAGLESAPALVELAADLLVRPLVRTRLWGYAVLRDLWGLHSWLRGALAGSDPRQWGAPAEDMHTWEPWLNLHAHAAGTSWLAELIDRPAYQWR